MQFRPGNYVHFISRKAFALGTTGVVLQEGMSVFFDGSTAILNDFEEGDRYTLPNLRGAVASGWLIEADAYYGGNTEAPPPVSAGMQIHPAVSTANPMQGGQQPKSFVTTVSANEQIVGNASERAAGVRETNKTSRFASTGRIPTVDAHGQSGTVVRTVSTPAKWETEVTAQSLGGLIRQAESVKIQAGEGRSEADLLASMSDEERDQYEADKEARRESVLARAPGSAKLIKSTPTKSPMAKLSSKKVTESGGMKVTTTVSNGGTDIDVSALDRGGKARVETIDVGGIKVTNTNGPRRANQPISGKAAPPQSPILSAPVQARIVKDGTEDPRKMIAKKLCPDFPEDYNFADHWKRRLAMIRLNFEARADVIQAIFMAESDDFKKVLLEEFPEVFAPS